MDDKSKKYAKWVIVGLLAMGAGLFVAPMLAVSAWNIVNACIALTAVAAFAFLAPAIAEGLATLGWKAKQLVWKTAPVDKLWRDLHSFGEEIETLEENIAEVVTAEEYTRMELKKQRSFLDQADMQEWEENISFLTNARNDLIADRDHLRSDYRDMERIVRKEEANWKIGNAFNKTADTLQRAGKIAAGTQGSRVSIDAIQERLAQGRARLAVLKSRKPLDRPKVIDTTVTDITDQKTLTNVSSPVLPTMIQSKVKVQL